MDQTSQGEAWRLFERAIDLDESDRQKLLSEVRQTQPLLAGEVESLLKHEAAAGENPFWRRPLAEERPDEVPAEIGPYRVVREIGRGGMGVVYEALHVDMGLDKRVALKVLPAQCTDSESRERFYREARLAASLHHTHIVPVLNAGIHDGRPWYAMAYVRGGNLSAVVRSLRQTNASIKEPTNGDVPAAAYQSTGGRPHLGRGRPHAGSERLSEKGTGPLGFYRKWLFFSPTARVQSLFRTAFDDEGGSCLANENQAGAPCGEAVPPIPCQDVTDGEYFRWVAGLGIQAAKALDYAHHAEGRGLIHRDIKPANLLLDDEGALWITDFGLAKRLTDPTLTADNRVFGTPCYMSPEQASSKPLDRRTDVYSLGATLYELLTLRAVFTGAVHQVLKQIEQHEPESPRRHNRATPRDLEAIVCKALAKRPAERYQAAADLADDLERWLTNRPVRARRISAAGHALRWCRRQPLAVALILSLVVGSFTSIYFGLSAGRRAREADDARELADRRAVEAAEEARRADDQAAEAGRQARRADDQTAEAVAHARESHQRMVAHHVASGAQLLDGGDALAALPWFVEALRLDACDPDRARLHRLRVAGAFEASPRLLHAWFHTGRVRGLCLSGDERRVITAGDDGLLQTHDRETGQLLATASFGNPIVSFSAAAGGERIAVSTACGTVHVWDMEREADLAGFMTGRRDVGRVLLSGDGQQLATLHLDRYVRVWNVETGAVQAGPIAHPNDVLCWSFSPDGRRLLTGTGGRATPARFNQAQIWDTETGRPITPAMTHADDVLAVSWSADGSRVATGGWDNVAQVWDAVTGTPLLPHPVRHDSPVSQVLMTRDGRFLVTGSEDQTVRVWDIPQGTPIGPKLQHGGPLLDVRLAPDESCIAAAGFDRSVRFWNAHDGSSPLSRLPHLAAVERVVVTREGYAVTACADGAVRVWDVRTSGEPLLSLPSGACAEQVVLSPDETRLLTASGRQNNIPNHFARVWDAQSGAALGPPLSHGAQVEWAEFSPDGRMIVTASHDGTARLWNAADSAAVGEPLVHRGRLHSAIFHPDGKSVLTASADGTARLWDVATCKERLRVKHSAAVNRAVLSRSGELIATASEDQTVRIWVAATGKPCVPELKHDGPVLELAFSPDGRRLATASGKTARIWDVDMGQPLAPPLVHAGLVRTIAFSPDGERLATGSYDWTARVWDANSGAPLTPFLHHDDNVNRVAFSSDGALLATASGGPIRANVGDARVWDAATGEPLTPWLRHGNDVLDCRFDRAGKFLYTASWDRHVRKWELSLDQRPLDELQHLAELSAGYRIDKMTGIASVESREFQSRWPAQNARERSIAVRSPGALAQWHQQRSATAQRSRDWPLAAYHLAKLDEVRPDDASLLSRLAPIQWYLGDRDGYRESRRKLVALWRDNRPELLSNVAGVSLLDPDEQNDLPETFAALARSVDQNPKSCTWLHLHGALAYRLGNIDECVRSLDRANAIHGGQSPPQDVLFQAMASGRTGNLAAAQQLLDGCRQSIEVQRMAQPENLLADPSQYLAIEILGREAQNAVEASEQLTRTEERVAP